jgi:hypothetical protein
MRESIKASPRMLESDQSRRNIQERQSTGEVTLRGDPDTAPVERTPGVGGEKVDLGENVVLLLANRCFKRVPVPSISCLLTSASSNILATREKYMAGR